MSARIASGGVGVLFALAAAGCVSQAKETAPQPGEVAPAVEGPGISSEGHAEQPAHPDTLAGVGVGPIAGGAVMLPPPAGQSRTAIEGCLASAGTEEEGAKFPQRPATRSAAPPPVTVGISGLGVVVTHALSHACCLKAEVTHAIENGAVTVMEKLSGTPCRCMCSSTIRTAVGLAPGSYELAVQLQIGGGESSVVHRQKVEIKRLGR